MTTIAAERPSPRQWGERGRRLYVRSSTRAVARALRAGSKSGGAVPVRRVRTRLSLRKVRKLGITEQSAQFTGSTFGRHICAFFYSIDEQHRVLRPFIKDGFERGDKAFHLVDPERREEHLGRLAESSR